MADRPIRIQLSRTKGWKMPANTVKVDRSTIFGNPFHWAEFYFPGINTREDECAEAVRRFRASVIGFDSNGCHCRPVAHPDSKIGQIISQAPIQLRGKNLACWCKPGSPCHADVLLEIANG